MAGADLDSVSVCSFISFCAFVSASSSEFSATVEEISAKLSSEFPSSFVSSLWTLSGCAFSPVITRESSAVSSFESSSETSMKLSEKTGKEQTEMTFAFP